jgi:DHA1 family bicyclomycin/chloramphenicol resistance-like MFS transporter
MGQVLAHYRKALRTPRFTGYALIAAGAHAGSHAFAAGAPAALIQVFGLNSSDCGLYVALPPLGFLIGSVVARRLTNWQSGDRLIAAGLLLLVPAGVTMIALAVAGCHSGLAIVGPMVVISAASALVTPSAVAASLRVESDTPRGLTAGLTTFLQIAGGMIATWALALAPPSGCQTLAVVIASGGFFALSIYICLRWLETADIAAARLRLAR